MRKSDRGRMNQSIQILGNPTGGGKNEVIDRRKLILSGAALFGAGCVAGEIEFESVAQATHSTDASSFHVTATGSTEPRHLDDRFADLVNVTDFGATGDGLTDDTIAFQSAADELPSQGGVIVVPAGDYSATIGSLSVGSKLITWVAHSATMPTDLPGVVIRTGSVPRTTAKAFHGFSLGTFTLPANETVDVLNIELALLGQKELDLYAARKRIVELEQHILKIQSQQKKTDEKATPAVVEAKVGTAP